MRSDAGLRVAQVAQAYARRPSEMIGGLSDYEAFCVDEALAHRMAGLEQAESEQATAEPTALAASGLRESRPPRARNH